MAAGGPADAAHRHRPGLHGGQPAQHNYEGLTTPSLWRGARSQAAAKVDALGSNGMDEIETPAFLRKQAD
jgi:cell division protein FtsZ